LACFEAVFGFFVFRFSDFFGVPLACLLDIFTDELKKPFLSFQTRAKFLLSSKLTMGKKGRKKRKNASSVDENTTPNKKVRSDSWSLFEAKSEIYEYYYKVKNWHKVSSFSIIRINHFYQRKNMSCFLNP
jgi:hypothetical protein